MIEEERESVTKEPLFATKYKFYIWDKKDGSTLIKIKGNNWFLFKKHLIVIRDSLTELLEKKNIDAIIDGHNNYVYNRIKEEEEQERNEWIKKQNADRTQKPRTGVVYLLQDRLQRTKIGKTNDLDKRIFSISRLHPEKLTLFHHFISKDVTQSERDLHNKYKEYRLNGEWFNLPQEELNKIKEVYL